MKTPLALTIAIERASGLMDTCTNADNTEDLEMLQGALLQLLRAVQERLVETRVRAALAAKQSEQVVAEG